MWPLKRIAAWVLRNELAEISGMLGLLLADNMLFIRKADRIMATLDDVKTKVDAEATVVASAVTLLAGLKAALDAAIASGDPVKLQALSDSIGTQTDALAAAVAANTPAA